MGAKALIKAVLSRKKVTQAALAEMLPADRSGTSAQEIRDKLYHDRFKYSTVEEWLDVLGVDLVARDRETGEIYG